jgi:hypothetical protein
MSTNGCEWYDFLSPPTLCTFLELKLTLPKLIHLADERNVVQRRAGIVWKNLKVCGSGSAINLQKDVASLLLAPFRYREFFGKGTEKTILNDFEGVLKSGEMLIVLGRPGSGCSTLLKTLMGELSGLDLKSQSEIHYNGMYHLHICFFKTLTIYRYHPKTDAQAV